MSRRDFELIAGVLRMERLRVQTGRYASAHDEGCALLALSDAARAFAQVLADDNARFDRERFMAACGCPLDGSQ